MPANTPQKRYQTIIAALQSDIAEGRVGPSQRLPPERVLVERFGVSRLTVREALIGMEIMGLVEARRGSGVYVIAQRAKLTASELDIGAFELMEARRLVEGECAALAAITGTSDDRRDLEAILTQMISENEGKLSGEVADREFHVRLAQATRNQALVLVIQTLWDIRDHSPLCREMLQRSRSAGVKPQIDDHRAIIDAIAARDPRRAREAMHDHLGRVIDNLLVVTELEAIERARQKTEELRSRRVMA